MITCPSCHAQLSDDAKFCGNCAAPLTPEVLHPSAQNEEDAFVGKCIDNKYFIVKRMASGGMGVVYLAKQKGVGLEVAIKKLHSQNYRDPKIVERFVNEARSYAKITHPNAVKLHDLLNIDGQLCLVMEFVHGKTLTTYIEGGTVFTIRQILDISLQLADALATVHQAGIIHRDLKTENVMLLETVKGRYSVKILDFGIAKMMDKQTGNLQTQEGLLVGTPEFMSPEQCYGKTVDHRADIYAFGILMFAMICGKLPFNSDTALSMIQQQLHTPTPPCTRPDKSEVPKDLEAVVRKCMAKSADERYQNFADVITDLTSIQEGKPITIASASKESEWNAAEHSKAVEVDNSIQNPSMEPQESPKSAPKSSMVLGKIDILEDTPEDGDFQFSIDESDDLPQNADESESDEEPSGSFSEDDDIVLGDLDENMELSAGAHSRHGKSGIVVALIMLLLIAGGVYLLSTNGMNSSTPREKEAPVLPQALQTSAEPIPVKDAADENKAIEPAAVQEVKPVEPDPVPASETASRQNIERGILRAAIRQADTRLNAGELEKAAGLMAYITPKKDSLQDADSERFASISAKNTQFNDMTSKAAQAMKHYNCSDITRMIETIPEEAVGMRNQMQKQAAKCDNFVSKPPTTL